MEEMEALLAADMEEVASAVYLAIQHDKEHDEYLLCSASEWDIQESNCLNGNLVMEAISEAVQSTSYLKRVLPVGVIVGSTLASLRNFFNVAALHDHRNGNLIDIDQHQINGLKPENNLLQEAIQLHIDEDSIDQIPKKASREKLVEKLSMEKPVDIIPSVADVDDGQGVQSQTLNRDTLMVGAVTAALGASALLSQQDVFMGSDSSGTSSSGSIGKHVKTETVKNEEVVDDKQESNIVTSLAEKAMSVAGPIVPTKEGGEVDQERIVAMLAGLGQRGGVFKLVGKLALLWGGLRGAMSLTDRLFKLLRIADRPLWQRSLHAIPGLWLLSLALAGARLRKQGSLFIPIGMRTGIIASTFLLQTGGFLTYLPKSRFWMGGTHPSQPFSGVVGLLVALSLAVILYPRQQGFMIKVARPIQL